MTETYLNFEEEHDFKPHSSAKMFKWHPKKKNIKWLPVLIFFRAISGGSPRTILDLKVLLQADPPASRVERITLEMLGEVGEVLKRRTKHYPISPFLQVRTTFLVPARPSVNVLRDADEDDSRSRIHMVKNHGISRLP